MNLAVVAMGSNIDPETNIRKAREALFRGFMLKAESSFVWTRPIGLADQDDFLNGAVLVETEQDLPDLRHTLKALETALGRKKREEKFGPREIDLDVVVWNGQVVDKDFYERDFLQKSVREILPKIKMRCC